MKYNIKNFTLEEKFRLLIGKDLWHTSDANGKLPMVRMSDGPNGLRMHSPEGPEYKSTAMPTVSALCNSWNPQLTYTNAAVIADECIEKGTDILLGPAVNVKRTPLCGRNFEYCSEDPYLAGVMGKAYVEGMQDKGVGTSVKHYLANNREYDRNHITSEVDERTLREIYMVPFEFATQAKPWTVMCSYNRINGLYASEHRWALNDVLRDEFGFDGVVVSDWGATHNAMRAVKGALDVTMPYEERHYNKLKEAYDKGWLTEEEIDARVENVLRLVERKENADKIKKQEYTKEQRHGLAAELARECIVLLKNEDDILPLKQKDIVVAGMMALDPPMTGGGSGFVFTEHKSQSLVELLNVNLENGGKARYSEGLWNTAKILINGNAIYRAAYGADVTVLCVGTDSAIEGESFDRETLRLPLFQEDLILNTAKVTENLVVVMFAGSAVDVSPWIDKVKAVVYAGFAGEGVNEALADVLTGKVCPSGKLSETFPLCVEDTPTGMNRGNGWVDRYAEGVMIGYRWYDTKEKGVAFPFGHGLSYAKFEYSDLAIEKLSETDYEVSWTVKNISDITAKEVSQLYVRDVFATVERPLQELKGFTKTELKGGESKRMHVKLDARSFAFYNVSLGRWYVENGDFEIRIGASSRDIRLIGKLCIEQPENEQYSQF